jgi:hypothetical protein
MRRPSLFARVKRMPSSPPIRPTDANGVPIVWTSGEIRNRLFAITEMARARVAAGAAQQDVTLTSAERERLERANRLIATTNARIQGATAALVAADEREEVTS